MKRRAAIEPGIGHLKREHRMDRNRLKGKEGDCFNAILSAAGMNFTKLVRWLANLLRLIFAWIFECQRTFIWLCYFLKMGFSGLTWLSQGSSTLLALIYHKRKFSILLLKDISVCSCFLIFSYQFAIKH